MTDIRRIDSCTKTPTLWKKNILLTNAYFSALGEHFSNIPMYKDF